MADEALQPQEALNETEPEVSQSSPTEENSQGASESHDDSQEQDRPTRAQRRISDLSRQLKEERQQRQMTQEQANEFFANATQPADPWQAYQDGNITIDQLREVVKKEATQTASFEAQKEAQKLRQELAEVEYWRGLDADVRQLEAKHPKFNYNSPEYDAEYVDELSKLYADTFGRDTASLMKAPKLSDFVGRIEKLRSKAEAQGVEKSSAQLAQQAAEGAVIGTTGSKQTKRSGQDLVEEGKQKGDFTNLFKAMANS